MTDKVSLPPPTEPLTTDAGAYGAGGPFSYTPQVKQAKKIAEPWYRWFSKINTALNSVGDGFDGATRGTFVPTVTSTGGTFNWTIINGEYEKLGSSVNFSVRLLLANSGNVFATQPVTVGNLPYAAANNANNIYVCPLIFTRAGATFTSMQFYILGGATSGKFSGLTAAAASATNPLTDDQVFHPTNITDLWISGCYQST